MATAIVQTFYPEREANLGPILDAIARVPTIENTIVWINRPDYRMRFPRPHVQTIQSSFDTLVGQYAAAFVSSSAMIYCQNDDLILAPDAIGQLIDRAESMPLHMVGILGSNLDRGSERPYGNSTDVHAGHADLLVGRAWAADKRALVSGFHRMLEGNLYPGRGEDMFFTFGRAYVEGGIAWEDIPTNNIGLCHEQGHAEARDFWARYLIAAER